MRNPDDRNLAFECLRLAAQNGYQTSPSEVIAAAERYYAFASGDDADERLAAVLRATLAKWL